MSDSLQLVLRQSLEDVLEKMFFVRPIEDSGPDSQDADSELTARLAFDGEPSGSLTLRVTRDAAESISADFLGVEDGELNQQQVGEVICELANMICGSVLSRVESAATFQLAPPRLLEETDEGRFPETSVECAAHSMQIGRGSLTVLVKTESAICSMAEKHGS